MKRRTRILEFRVPVLASLGIALLITAGCTREPEAEEAAVARLTLPQRVKTFDPVQADDTYSMSQVGLAYEGLLQYHYLKRPYEVTSALAESVPEPESDGTVFTFKLRKGTLFQDDPAFGATGGQGREVVAEDVAYSIKRIADPKLNSPGWWLFDGKIIGLNEWRGAAARSKTSNYDTPVEGLAVVDRYTIRIKLTREYPLFLHYLATTYASVVSREAVERYGDDFFRTPVGTGPFRLSREKSSLATFIVWTRNQTYRESVLTSAGAEESGKRLPFLERIEVSIIGEPQRALSLFLEGNLDLLPLAGAVLDTVMPGGKELAQEYKDKGFQLLKSPSQDLVGICLNLRDAVLGPNKVLRQALSLAVDVDEFNALFYGGHALPAAGPVPPGLEGHVQAGKNPHRRFDVADAKKLLRKAGYPGGMGLPEFSLATLDSGTYGQMAEYLQRAFKEIGVNARIDSFGTWAEFMSAVKSGKSHFWVFAWSADYPDAENFMQLFYGKVSTSGPNDSGYANPKFDALYEELIEQNDGRARKETLRKMVGMLQEDVPWIWAVHRLKYSLVQSWLRNVSLHDYDHAAARFYRVDGPGKMRDRAARKR